MAKHRVFVIAADVKKGCEKPLRARLEQLEPPLRDNGAAHLKLESLTMLHYASFVVFDGEKLAASPDDKPPSKLIFECNIDGSEKRFLDLLLDDPAIDDIYEHCEGYPARDAPKADKLAYLTKKHRLRWPQLFHIGAPYRSVESIKKDRALRLELDRDLDGIMAPSLSDYRARTPAGMREYWRWEIFKPWVAWLIPPLVLGPAIGLGYVAWGRLQSFAAYAVPIVCAGAFFWGSVAARKMWVTALPDLRDRVWPWLRWAAAALVLAAASWRLWTRHRNWAIGLIAVFALLACHSVWATVRRRWNERLLEIRTNSTMPVVEIWRVLKRHAIEIHDTSEWFTRFINWMPWPSAYLVVLGLVWLLEPHRWLLVTVFSALLFAKTLWLAALLGWPASKKIQQDVHRIVAFIAVVTAAGASGLWVLTELGTPPMLLALIILVGFFTLWAMPLPSPNVPLTKLDSKDLATILEPEDRGVQNHMAAVVALNQDHRFRVPVLRSFLWLLNRFYFRCILADVFRGKLWGIPTVQFAQWVLLDRRNYLFLSNYDSSWTSYLDDFGAHLTTGIQKIWGQGENNPGTKDLGHFKDYARTTMVTHSLWYRAYPGLSLRQVWNNEEIRRGLATATGEEAMVRTLRRLGASPKVLPDQLHATVK